jgi:AraC-like DNA-binding protein
MEHIISSMARRENGQKLLELAALIARFAPADGGHATAVPGLTVHRWSAPTEPANCMYEPSLVVVAQGAKRVLLSERSYVHDPATCLVTSIELPVVGQVLRASADAPFLAIKLRLDLQKIADLVALAGPVEDDTALDGPGISSAATPVPLLDAVMRLVRLLASPRDVAVMAPLIEREIHYRLINSAQGMHLRHIAVAGSRTGLMVEAIAWIKTHYARPLRIGELAGTVNMSESALHHHFKAVTAMSPLQYQKRLRLQEARRLMLSERLDAASASQLVGYESPSQFSREYRRMYGAPPLRDIVQLRDSEFADDRLARAQ